MASGDLDRILLTRFDSQGRLDSSFGEAGVLLSNMPLAIWRGSGYRVYPTDMLLTDDNKIVVTANTYGSDPAEENPSEAVPDNLLLVRYTSDGSLDSTFNEKGYVISDFGGDERGILISKLTFGRLLIVVYKYDESLKKKKIVLARYSRLGTLDPTFGENGFIESDCLMESDYPFHRALVQDDGKVVIGGSTVGDDNSTDLLLERYEY